MTFILPGGIGQLSRGAGFSTWSTFNSTSGIVPPPGFSGPPNATGSFSNNNRTMISGTTGYVINATNTLGHGQSGQTGKYYFEITNTAVITDLAYVTIGVAVGGSSIYTAGVDTLSIGLTTTYNTGNWTSVYNNAQGATFTTAAANTDRIGVAVDMSSTLNAPVYFRLNGTWLNNGAPSATLTTPDGTIPTQGGGAWIMASTYNANAMTLNTGQVAFGNAAPSGYVAWG